MFQIRGDRCDHNARVHRHEFDAADRQPEPRIQDDSFVKNSIEDVDDIPVGGRSFDL